MSAEQPGAGPGTTGFGTEGDNRSINRLPVRVAVSRKGRSALIGRTRDISLHGVFIETKEPLDVGVILPLSIELSSGLAVEVQGEVVRKTADGMAVRFHRADKESAKTLRRWVVDFTSVQGSKKQVEQLLEESAHIKPIRRPERIAGLLEEIRRSKANVTFIPVERLARDYARLVEVGPGGLVFESSQPSMLKPQEDVYALLTLTFVSYSFQLSVLSVEGSRVRCGLPELVVFSERRVRSRRAAPEGSVLRWPSPHDPRSELRFPLIDLSDDGLSFRAPQDTLIVSGTPLTGATVEVEGRIATLESAEVRHVSATEGHDGAGPGLRVGVALGAARLGRVEQNQRSRSRRKPGIFDLLGRMKEKLSIVFAKGKEQLAGPGHSSKRVIVRSGELPIVGLLDTTGAAKERIKAPLVIVVPGFAGRKEQLAFLAGTLIEGFQRQGAEVGVLRIDGTNNLGESGKDPDCRAEGTHCLHYTVTGIVEDTLAALNWARRNPHIEPTHIVLVSVSMASIGVRHVMTRPEASDVSLWFSYMGAADAIDTVKNVSGNIDFHAYYMRGEKVGIISLNGVLNDGDHFWKDLHDKGIGYLDSAKDEMARIKGDVVWLRGKYDAFMDPRRIEALMRVPAEGKREIIDVESGHLPRTSDLAIAQFAEMTRRIWQHVHKSQMPGFSPSFGRLALKHDAEWKSIRREGIADRTEWWRQYLLDQEGVGFDILEYAPEYDDLMRVQVDGIYACPRVQTAAEPVILELGAGTGNLARRLVKKGARVIATDLVKEALAQLPAKMSAEAATRLETHIVDVDGTPLTAVARFLANDLHSVSALVERLPGLPRPVLDELLQHQGPDLHAALLGHELDLAGLGRRLRLSTQAQRLLLDLNTLARVARRRVDPKVARGQLATLPPSILETGLGLPFERESVDAVAMSLVLSYLEHPEDTLFECHRVLRPGGVLMVSSLVRDSESSKLYLDLVTRLATMPESDLPSGVDPVKARAHLVDSARRFVDHAGELFRLEEEGLFRFFDGKELTAMVARRGFTDISISKTFGDPPQAVVVTCRKA